MFSPSIRWWLCPVIHEEALKVVKVMLYIDEEGEYITPNASTMNIIKELVYKHGVNKCLEVAEVAVQNTKEPKHMFNYFKYVLNKEIR